MDDNDGGWPLKQREILLMIPNRPTRRQTTQSIVVCPCFVEFEQSDGNGDETLNNQDVVDALGKEGGKNEEMKVITSGCTWKGI